jgi:excisionase family DNA binding protein
MKTQAVKYLNIQEYAKYMNVSRQTVHRWIKDGKELPMKTIAGRKVFVVSV